VVCWMPKMVSKTQYFFFVLHCDTTRAMASSFMRFPDHAQRRTTVGRTPLDEWSAPPGNPCLTTHNIHKTKTAMSLEVFGPAIPASKRPKIHAATGIGLKNSFIVLKHYTVFISFIFILYVTMNCTSFLRSIFLHDATAPQWARASRSHTDTRHSVGLLWTSDQADEETSTCTTHNAQKRHPCPRRIRTRNPKKRAIQYPRLRPRGHRDDLFEVWCQIKGFFLDCLSLEMGQIGCSETSVINHSMMRNIPEEWRSYLNRDEALNRSGWPHLKPNLDV
jgi:hypothetical protein